MKYPVSRKCAILSQKSFLNKHRTAMASQKENPHITSVCFLLYSVQSVEFSVIQLLQMSDYISIMSTMLIPKCV